MASQSVRAGLYKTRNATESTTTLHRIKVTDNLRRESRWTALLQKRNIAAFMSPMNSPQTNPKKIDVPKIKKSESDKRLEQLKKWQEEKKKKLRELRKKSKPIFKVPSVNQSHTENLTDVYSKIKGLKIAPSSTHKFKPPSNIRALNMKVPETVKSRCKIEFKLGNTSKRDLATANLLKKSKRSVRESADSDRSTEKEKTIMKKSTSKSVTSLIDSTTVREKDTPRRLTRANLHSTSEEVSESNQKEVSNKQNGNLTPVSSATVKANISPFVTMSRGKDKSRKEYHEKRTSIEKNTAAAALFENLLDNEMERLNQLCHKWEAYKASENLPEEASDMIRMAIGQTNLLMQNKFVKFRELIGQCRDFDPEKLVTCFDLHGFWDILQIQINNINTRFENLNRLKTNNWEEILPVPQCKVQEKPIKINRKKKKEVKSSLRNLIQDRRKENKCKTSPIITVTTRRSQLLNISNTTNMTTTPISLRERMNTPKSILKSSIKKNLISQNIKTVLFVDDDNKENVAHSSDPSQLGTLTPVNPYLRRSSRLAEKRIQFS